MRTAGITTVGEFHYFHHGSTVEEQATAFSFDEIVIRAARDAGAVM